MSPTFQFCTRHETGDRHGNRACYLLSKSHSIVSPGLLATFKDGHLFRMARIIYIHIFQLGAKIIRMEICEGSKIITKCVSN